MAAPTVHLVIDAATDRQGEPPLVFDTLRRGFPTAEVHVVDGGPGEARATIAEWTDGVGGHLRRTPGPAPLYSILNDIVMNCEHPGPAVIVSPRLVFWSSCEEWSFDAVVAGRLVPTTFEPDTGYISIQRLLPSFWWIRDLAELRDRLEYEFRNSRIGCLDAFLPYMFRDRTSRAWYRMDVGANLYSALLDDVAVFSERQLDCYDCVDPADTDLAPAGRSRAHLKGLWRAQADQYKLRAVPGVMELIVGR